MNSTISLPVSVMARQVGREWLTCEEGFSQSSNNLAVRPAIVVPRARWLEDLLPSTSFARVSLPADDGHISVARKSCCRIRPLPAQASCGGGLWTRQALFRTGTATDQQLCVFSFARPDKKLFCYSNP